jgi:hypothetical protein
MSEASSLYEKHYPVKYVIAHSLVLAAMSLILIVLQHETNEYTFFLLHNDYGIGVLVGVYLFVISIFPSLVSQYIFKFFK